MKAVILAATCVSTLIAQSAFAQNFEENRPQVSTDDHLVLVVDRLLSLSHNVPGFQAPITENYLPGSDQNINLMDFASLDRHLTTTALVSLNGEIVGIATETEIIYGDGKDKRANSMWLVRLNAEGMTGFLAVEQIEDASGVDALMKSAPDTSNGRSVAVRTTMNDTRTLHASGDLSRFESGLFEEYNLATQSPGSIQIEFYANN